jgi:carboxypeptidase Taq
MNHDAALAELKQRLQTISDLHGARAVLSWDQATHMPTGGAVARGRQLALLSGLAHERMTDPEIGRLLDASTPWAEAQAADSDGAALIRVTRRDYDRATRVPNAFIQRFSEHTREVVYVWESARPANDFAAVRPLLETTVELSRELRRLLSGYDNPYDALIDHAEDGMTVDAVRKLFGELRRGLVPLIDKIRQRPPLDDRCLKGDFPEAAQMAFGERIARAFGYDFERGRQDKTAHPFMISSVSAT